jgi:hypothetical protein
MFRAGPKKARRAKTGPKSGLAWPKPLKPVGPWVGPLRYFVFLDYPSPAWPGHWAKISRPRPRIYGLGFGPGLGPRAGLPMARHGVDATVLNYNFLFVFCITGNPSTS